MKETIKHGTRIPIVIFLFSLVVAGFVYFQSLSWETAPAEQTRQEVYSQN